MYLNVSDLTSKINSQAEAEKLVSELLLKFASEATLERVSVEASLQHRTTEEVASQTVSNLFRSFKTRRDRW